MNIFTLTVQGSTLDIYDDYQLEKHRLVAMFFTN